MHFFLLHLRLEIGARVYFVNIEYLSNTVRESGKEYRKVAGLGTIAV